jgi:hypothetical protein
VTDFTARRFEISKDLDLLGSWCRGWGIPPTHPGAIPRNTWIVSHKASAICLAMLYETDSNIAYLGFTLSDPALTSEGRADALSFLYDIIEKRAKSLGYKMIIAPIGHPSVINILQSKDYQATDRNVVTLLKKL